MDSDSGSDVEPERSVQVMKRKEGGPEVRPPSSYGSMKSEEEEVEEEPAEAGASLAKPEIPGTTYGATLLQLNRSESPETLWTEATPSTRHPGAYFKDGKLEGALDEMEDEDDDYDDDEDWDSPAGGDSPEPPEQEEEDSEASGDEPGEDAELGTLHPELDLPFIFRAIQSSLSPLSGAELFQYKRNLCGRDSPFTMDMLADCDHLDLVDKLMEAHGKTPGLMLAIRVLRWIERPDLSDELELKCKRAVVQHELKVFLIRKYNTIHEGVPRAGGQLYLHLVYVEPIISTRGHGGVVPYHPLRVDGPPSPVPQLPSPDSFIGANAIFRPTAENPARVRTILTTGLPGIGFTVAVQKVILDWCKDKANKDIQFIFKLKMWELYSKRERHQETQKKTTFMDVLKYYWGEVKDSTFLDKPDCRALYILEAMDLYKTPLDFKNAPVVKDMRTEADLDTLLVNLIRGTLLPDSLVWITGRRAATTQIPAELLDRTYEIQGYSDAMKDEFFTKRYTDKVLAGKILAHLKDLPALYSLCHMPFMCWMVAMVFERGFRDDRYGRKPAKLTPFYVHFLIVQTNRKLEKYYGGESHIQNWTDEERDVLIRLGKMGLRLIEKQRSVFYEEDMKEFGLTWVEVAMHSGLCTEIPLKDQQFPDRRQYCFVHYTFQEFMAAFYVFLSFRLEGKTVLDHSLRGAIPHLSKDRNMVDLLRGAIDRTLGAPFGQYDMFLRFLCGLALRVNNNNIMRGLLVPHNCPLLKGLEEGAKLLAKRRESAPPERHHNLDECIRELTQADDP